jgi:hypothetical protein
MGIPDGLEEHGTRLWNAITEDFNLIPSELELLENACRSADLCVRLDEIVRNEGVMLTTRLGETKTHPAVIALRNERSLLGKLLVVLRVPVGEDDERGDQERGGFRGWQMPSAVA